MMKEPFSLRKITVGDKSIPMDNYEPFTPEEPILFEYYLNRKGRLWFRGGGKKIAFSVNLDTPEGLQKYNEIKAMGYGFKVQMQVAFKDGRVWPPRPSTIDFKGVKFPPNE